MGKYNIKKMLLEIQYYIKVYENSRIKGWNILKNCYEISEKLVRYFLQLNINNTKAVSHEYISSEKFEKPYRIFKVLTKF